MKEPDTGPAQKGAFWKGVAAAERGHPLSSCPYIDQMCGKHLDINTYSRGFRRFWLQGYTDKKAEMNIEESKA